MRWDQYNPYIYNCYPNSSRHYQPRLSNKKVVLKLVHKEEEEEEDLLKKKRKKKKKGSLLPSSAGRRATCALTWNTPMMIHRSSMSVLRVKLKPISGFFWALISCCIIYLSPPTWYALSSSFKLLFVWMKRTINTMLQYLSILSKKIKAKENKREIVTTVTELCFFNKGGSGRLWLFVVLVLLSLTWVIEEEI